MQFDWKMKLGIAVLVIILLLCIAPGIFGDIFKSIADVFVSCDKAARDIELPKVNK